MYTKTMQGFIVTKNQAQTMPPPNKLLTGSDSSQSHLAKPSECPQYAIARITLFSKLRSQGFLFNTLLSQKQEQKQQNPQKDFAQDVANDMDAVLDSLFDEDYGYFEEALATSLIESYYRVIFRVQVGRDAYKKPPALPDELYDKYHDAFYAQQDVLRDVLQKILQEPDSPERDKAIRDAFSARIPRIDDLLHQAELDAQQFAYQFEENLQYRYVISGDDACEACQALADQLFAASDIQEGVNYPLIHPNCRCTTVLEGFEDDKAWETAYRQSLSDKPESGFHPLQTFLNAIAGKYTFFFIDGRAYRVDMENLQNPMILRDGTAIQGSHVSDADIEMLHMMKQWEEAETKEAKEEAFARIVELLLTQGDDISVSFKKPLSYYTLDEDVTDRLNDFMRASNDDYANDTPWMFRLAEFYDLVRNGGPFDLKNQEEWQKAGFVYEGEIVDGDALGNISYGYLGKVLGIPDEVLLVAAGVAQVAAGTSDLNFLLGFGDDPRDQMRIMQGINQYYADHPEEKRSR
jgi:hypothetical protein